MEELHRIFVGGLFDSITKDELKDRFESFGDVTDVTIVQKNDGEGVITKTFGYVNLKTTSQKLNKCFAVYGGTKWKGHQLKVQLAKEDFMTRLQRERDEPVAPVTKKRKHCTPTKTYTDIMETTSTMKNTLPGAPVEGERNWVIGKYGRPLPIVYIPKVSGRKTMKVDPSKFCHCLKKIVDDGDEDVDVKKLTWAYDDDGDVIKKKKKKKKKNEVETNGEFITTNTDNNDTKLIVNEIPDTNCRKKMKKNEMKENMPGVLNGDVSLDANGDDVSLDVVADDVHILKQKKKKKKKVSIDIVADIEMEVRSHSNTDVTESSESFQSQEKEEKEKEEEFIIKSSPLLSSTPANSQSVSDDPLQKEKKKHKCKKMKDVVETAVQTENTIKQNGRLEDPCSKSPTHDVEEEKEKEKVASCIYEESESKKTPHEKKRLSISIIEQLANKNLTPSSPANSTTVHHHRSNNDEGDVEQNDIDEDDGDTDDGETFNMFDFEFQSSGSKNESFLSMLLKNIEMREDVNNIGEDSDVESSNEGSDVESSNKDGDVESSNEDSDVERSNESECSSSNSSGSEVKEPSLDVENNKTRSLNEESTPKLMNNSHVTKNGTKEIDFKIEQLINNPNEVIKQKETVKNLDSTDNSSPIKKSKVVKCSKEEKHALSEEKRAQSLSAKSCQLAHNKNAVSKALKDVDKVSSNANRIVFDESDGDGEDEDEGNVNVNKITEEVEEVEEKVEECDVKEKQLWSDDDDDEDGCNNTKNRKQLFDDVEDEESDDEISLKPQFEGKEGEKLFKMQQRFGGDERFKLDERFGEAAEEVNEDEKKKKIDGGDEDGESEIEDLQKEKEMNFSVLEQVLGKPISSDKKECDYGEAFQRYDPENVQHEKYEVKVVPTERSSEDEEMETVKKKTPTTVQQLPEVSKDTFYSVDNSIQNLFTKGDETTSFSFFGSPDEETTKENDVCEQLPENQREDEPEENEENESDIKVKVNEADIKVKENESDIQVKKPSWKRGLEELAKSEQALKVDHFFTNENEMESEEKEMQTYLYIPDGDRRLEIGKRFVRSEEVEEITNQWKSIRRTLTEDYKKKHKDAVRRVRKMREKRLSRR